MGPEAVYAIRRERLTKLSLAFALLLLASISYVTYRSTVRFADSAQLVDQTHLVIKQINQVLADVREAENAQRGYLITGDTTFLQPYDAVVTRLPDEIALLRELAQDNPAQQQAITELDEMIAKKMRILRIGIDTLAQRRRIDNMEMVALVAGEDRQLMYRIRTQVERMIASEESLLVQRAEILEAGTRMTKAWILLGNLLAAALLIMAFFAVLLEIAQHRHTNGELAMSAAQLELTNKELESFSYSVSHDLRSPLRAIDGYSRIFEEDFADRLDAEGLRLLAVIRSSSKKMGQLIDDLLSFSRMGRKPVDAAMVDMNLLVDDVWQEVSAGHDNVKLNKPSLPAVWGDRALLRQVLHNLLSNAVKYSSSKSSPVVDISAEKKADEFVYCVRDNGVGFDMRFYNKLFGVFQRLHTENEFPGTGVGLAIAQRVVVRHGGRIWADSKLGEYAAFYFSLPIKNTKEAI
jgi:signal transduction histidine kinase